MILREADSQTDGAAILDLGVTPAQRAYVDDIADNWTRTSDHRRSFVMDDAGLIVGFFQIDSRSGERLVPGALELRSFFVSSHHQGRGHARAALDALPTFARARYPYREQICLTVNCRNDIARRLYLKAGFSDTGAFDLSGRSGPQHIFVMDL